jgi:hypothetical protein
MSHVPSQALAWILGELYAYQFCAAPAYSAAGLAPLTTKAGR